MPGPLPCCASRPVAPSVAGRLLLFPYVVKFNPMDILHSDDAILVLNKPAGLPVLPDGWQPDAPYLVKLLEEEFGKLWIVHRLDKVTSGVLVFARTAEAHRQLSLQFEKHQAMKTYHALAEGSPSWDETSANQPLRGNVGHRHRTIVDRRKGKASRTLFKVIKRFRGHVLLEAQPVTGRTHQVRAHAAAIGFPLLGDVLYGAPLSDLIARPALHAYSLVLVHPFTGMSVSFEAPYPDDFRSALESLASSRARAS
jgi:RluA family pseudouridine synthase